MKTVNIKGADELDDYIAMKNVVESTNDLKTLEELEQYLLSVDLKKEPKDIQCYFNGLKRYLSKKIEDILFGIN